MKYNAIFRNVVVYNRITANNFEFYIFEKPCVDSARHFLSDGLVHALMRHTLIMVSKPAHSAVEPPILKKLLFCHVHQFL